MNHGKIATVILTHFHTDNTGGVRALKEAAPDLKVAVHEAAAGYVAGTMALPRYPMFGGLLFSLLVRLRSSFFLPDIVLHDGDNIEGLTSNHLPGHTPGSIALLDTEKTLFTGDLVRSDRTSLSEGQAGFMTDLPASRDSTRKDRVARL